MPDLPICNGSKLTANTNVDCDLVPLKCVASLAVPCGRFSLSDTVQKMTIFWALHAAFMVNATDRVMNHTPY
jgi:hypothetical protein